MSNSKHNRSSARIMLLVGLLLVMAVSVTAIGAAPVPQAADLDGVAADKLVTAGKAKSYVVIMEGLPLIAYDGRTEGFEATKPAQGNQLDAASNNAQRYEAHLVAEQNKALRSVGASSEDKVHSYTVALNGFSAVLTEQQAAEMAKQAGVVKVMKDEWYQKETETTPTFLGLTTRGGAWIQGYDGEGVVVGVIDTGIWPEHPSFADDGSFAAPPITVDECDFGNTAWNPNDAPFECNNKLIGARQMLDTYRLYYLDADEFDSARDDDGHGTHTASTAAGNSGVAASIFGVPRGIVSGIAPRAHVVAYKGLGNLGGFGSDLAAAIDQAVADGVDVINYSIGSSSPSIGPDDVAFLFAADAGVHVATSNGNSGPGAATTGSPASVPWLTSVGASTQPRYFQGSASSSDGWEFFGASVTAGTEELPLVDAADAGDELCQISNGLDPAVVEGKIVLCKRGAVARVEKGLTVFEAGGAGMILYNASDSQSQVTDNHWLPAVHINNTDGLVIKDYIADSTSPVAQINAGSAIMIDAPDMAAFSSRGPNRLSPDIIKPDITAPGVQILAGASPFPDPGSVPGELFQAIAGTSMSSPHIAGIMALLDQAHPDWSPAMVKSAMMTTSYQEVGKEDGVTPADPFDMGAGHVNPGKPNKKGSSFQPGIVYDAGLFDYVAYTCGDNLEVFTAGTCDYMDSLGLPMDPSDLNVPSIGIGELLGTQTVVRTVTSVANENGWRTYKVSVDAPDGYEVTVSPQKLRLKSGQSATYEVTITNAGAPGGEWAFGSLTWRARGGKYNAYSPIAVKSAEGFSAPDQVDASGESGSASFDVALAYEGVYSAEAHGLEPAVLTQDSVDQDPDQTFDPSDVGNGATLHEFTLSGAAYFRMVLPPEGTADGNDLDVFVYDPNGDLVATSTNGGTDEQIDILLPMDGTWQIYIHGWLVPSTPTTYDMYTWAISATPGGNLVIDSAPTSASNSIEAIDVSWAGATAGQWHLGAVSHTGDASGSNDLMGLTLVNVDNR